VQKQPRPLSTAEREAIQALARNMPALWQAPTTTMADRKERIRQVIHHVLGAGEGASERLQLTIAWVGGQTTTGSTTRPMRRTEHLSYSPRGVTGFGPWPRLANARARSLNASRRRAIVRRSVPSASVEQPSLS
jgi:hypothetical protein